MLEIGIQNGGSLELWAKYFPNGERFVGCDINPECSRLDYDDPRIVVIIGDANKESTQEEIRRHSPKLDLVIDDGSHISSDIVQSFLKYFPMIVDGGAFVAEDLHCCYWAEWDGGLFDPFSPVTFFKHLADIINYEHWGLEKKRTDLLKGFTTKYGCELDDASLEQIHSIEFINSVCVIRKMAYKKNILGRRVVSGNIENITFGIVDGLMETPPQGHNFWSSRELSPYEELPKRLQELEERDEQLNSLNNELEESKVQVEDLNQIVESYEQSISWILTKPVRMVELKIKQIKLIFFYFGALFSNKRELKKIAFKSIRKGGANIEHHIELLKSKDYFDHVSKERGISPEFLRSLIFLGTMFLEFKKWWFSDELRKKYSELLAAFFRGDTQALSNIELSHFRVHIDKPTGLINIVDNNFVVSGWSVNLNTRTSIKVRVRIGKTVYLAHKKQREDVQRALASECKIPLEVGFSACPLLSMGLHRIWVDVESSNSSWTPVFRGLLFRKPQIFTRQIKSRYSYKEWCLIEHKRLKEEIFDFKQHIDVMIHKPKFKVVIDARGGLNGWEKTLYSIQNQIYPHYDLRILASVSVELPKPLAQVTKILQDIDLRDDLDGFIIFIECGQSLSSNALYEFANINNQYPEIDLIYGDEDCVSVSGERSDPFYKPDWSPDYLETFNYIGFPACFRISIARECLDNMHLYDLTLRFTERTTKIWHLAKIIGHQAKQQVDEKVLEKTKAKNISALQGRMSRTDRQGKVSEHELHKGCFDIELDLKCNPLVSIIIPTAGKTIELEGRQIDLITNVVDQIRNLSNYKNIEIIVIDNDDLSEQQKQQLADFNCRRLTYTEPSFNIPKKLNMGASLAKGELLLLMNDDIEILTPNWIERMLEHFEKPHVGVVGAKLLYPDGKTQHVGVVHNHGNPDHVRRLFPGDEAGYYFSTCGVRNYMAVTGAVMMTLSKVYRQIGGYSEELGVSYNDADYCLKVREKGYTILYAPRVQLTHMESQSRVASVDMDEIAWYQKRWASHIVSDPYYNEQFLTVASPTFLPNINQRLV